VPDGIAIGGNPMTTAWTTGSAMKGRPSCIPCFQAHGLARALWESHKGGKRCDRIGEQLSL
jgi:hypothetical protein